MSMDMSDTIVQINNYPADKYNVLIPVSTMKVKSDMQMIIVNEVRLDTSEKSNDIYKEKSTGKWAITKVGGMKLAAAANISILSSKSVKPDVCEKCFEMAKAVGKARQCGECSHRYDVKYVVTVLVPEPGGNFRKIPKSKEIDCEMEKMSASSEAQYKRFLPHRASIAESKAYMRCIRDALGLAAGYTIDDLKKPFIIAHIVPNPDAPEIREAIASSYLQSMGLLFDAPKGGQRAALTAGDMSETAIQERPALPEPEADPDDTYTEADYADADLDGEEPFPWADEMDEGVWCAECGQLIKATQSRNGQEWTPDMIKDYSEKTFGRTLCPEYQKDVTGGR